MASALLNRKQQILSKYSKQNVILPNEEIEQVEENNSFEKDANEVYIDEYYDEDFKISLKIIGNYSLYLQ